jgi:peroxiredoxin
VEFRNSSDVLYAEQLLQEGKRREAFTVLSEFVKKDPSSPQAWYLLSTLISGQEKQVQCLERALKLDPGHELARERLARVKSGVGGGSGRPKGRSKGGSSTLGIVVMVVSCLLLGAVGIGGYMFLSQPQAAQVLPPAVNNIIFSPTFTETLTPTSTFTPPATLTLTPTITPFPTSTPLPTETPVTPLALIYSTPTRAPITDDQIGVGIGLYAPDFSARLVGKEKIRVSLYSFTDHPVLLVFWSTDNPVGPKHLSTLQDIYNDYKAKGLVILAVGVNQELDSATEIQRERSLTFKVMIDPQDKIHKQYGNYELPFNVFIAPSGKISSYEVGFISYELIQRRLEPIMKGYVTPSPETPVSPTP